MRRLTVVLWVVAVALPRLATAQDVLFTDGFETADLSAWDVAATDGGDLAAAATAAMAGTHTGLAALVDDTTGLYVQDDTPQDEPSYRARFHFDTGDFDPGEAAGKLRTRVFIAFEEAPTRRLLAVVLRRQQGQYSLMARARRDDNSQANTGFFSLLPGPHAIEVAWRQASAADVADGTLELWIDGVPVSALTGLQNHASTVDFVRMGALSVKTGASGTLHWDEFESRRESYIGPCTAETCPPGCPPGFADCDGNATNGCEVSLDTASNTAPGENLGELSADSATGFSCPSQGCNLLLSRTGVGERHFTIRAREDSNCDAYLSFRFQLVVPSGIDYDIVLSGSNPNTFSCDPSCVSTGGQGQTDVVHAFRNDGVSTDDSFTVGIEVRFVDGASCLPWTLNVYRRDCL